MRDTYFIGACGIHARTARSFMTIDFTTSDRRDHLKWCVWWLKFHGIRTDPAITLPEMAAMLETLSGERPARAA